MKKRAAILVALAALLACDSKRGSGGSAQSDPQAEHRAGVAPVLNQSFAKTATLSDVTVSVAGPRNTALLINRAKCDKQLLAELLLIVGGQLREGGFETIQCASGGESLPMR